MSDMLKVALNCAQKGWFVFPLEAGKKTPDLSLVPHWSEDSSKDLKQIEEWWTKKPNDNIGIVDRSKVLPDADRTSPTISRGWLYSR